MPARHRHEQELKQVQDIVDERFVPFEDSLARSILALREAIMVPIRPVLRDANLTEQQWRVLRVLNDRSEEALDAQTLAAKCLLHAPSVTRIVRELESRALVTITRDEEDGRRRLVALTPTGKQAVEETLAHTMTTFYTYRDKYGKERVEALQANMDEFKRFMEQEHAAASGD